MKNMLKKPYHALLSAAFLATAMTSMASANASGISGVATQASSTAESDDTFKYVCAKGNFLGEIQVKYAFEHKNGVKIFHVHQQKYRITRANNQKGGNKANINFQTGTQDARGNKSYANSQYSPDAMKQDGIWHDLKMSPVSMPTDAGGRGWSTVEFIFDTSGTDPKCSETVSYFS